MYKPAAAYSKYELTHMISLMKKGDLDSLDEAVYFLINESDGVWHGRARAKISRNIKNKDLESDIKLKIAAVIAGRFNSERFAEQFKDQLKTAIKFAPNLLRKYASIQLHSSKSYMKRYANWIINYLEATERSAKQQLDSNIED